MALDPGNGGAKERGAGSATALSRRELLRGGFAAAGSTVALGAGCAGTALEEATGEALYPAPLEPGDHVRIVAPARPGDSRLLRGIQILESFGLVVEVADHVYDSVGYLAGTDSARLDDLNGAFRDPTVRCVFGARGGYGTQRISDGLDVDAVRADPKLFIGFSDLTCLHGRLWQCARLVSFYGPLANWTDARTGPDSIESMRKALMTRDPMVFTSDAAEPSSAVRIAGNGSGIASGRLLGGNLTIFETSLGTADVPSLDGAIFLFEDTGEAPYSYDRMLTQLLRTGALDRIAGVAIGQFDQATGAAGEWTAAQAVSDRLQGLGVPVLGGLRIGHGNGPAHGAARRLRDDRHHCRDAHGGSRRALATVIRAARIRPSLRPAVTMFRPASGSRGRGCGSGASGGSAPGGPGHHQDEPTRTLALPPPTLA